jgi:hypothetical protein
MSREAMMPTIMSRTRLHELDPILTEDRSTESNLNEAVKEHFAVKAHPSKR